MQEHAPKFKDPTLRTQVLVAEALSILDRLRAADASLNSLFWQDSAAGAAILLHTGEPIAAIVLALQSAEEILRSPDRANPETILDHIEILSDLSDTLASSSDPQVTQLEERCDRARLSLIAPVVLQPDRQEDVARASRLIRQTANSFRVKGKVSEAVEALVGYDLLFSRPRAPAGDESSMKLVKAYRYQVDFFQSIGLEEKEIGALEKWLSAAVSAAGSLDARQVRDEIVAASERLLEVFSRKGEVARANQVLPQALSALNVRFASDGWKFGEALFTILAQMAKDDSIQSRQRQDYARRAAKVWEHLLSDCAPVLNMWSLDDILDVAASLSESKERQVARSALEATLTRAIADRCVSDKENAHAPQGSEKAQSPLTNRSILRIADAITATLGIPISQTSESAAYSQILTATDIAGEKRAYGNDLRTDVLLHLSDLTEKPAPQLSDGYCMAAVKTILDSIERRPAMNAQSISAVLLRVAERCTASRRRHPDLGNPEEPFLAIVAFADRSPENALLAELKASALARAADLYNRLDSKKADECFRRAVSTLLVVLAQHRADESEAVDVSKRLEDALNSIVRQWVRFRERNPAVGPSNEPFEIVLNAFAVDESFGTARGRADYVESLVSYSPRGADAHLIERAFEITRSLHWSIVERTQPESVSQYIDRLKAQTRTLNRIGAKGAARLLQEEAVTQSLELASANTHPKGLSLAAATLEWAAGISGKNSDLTKKRQWELAARERWRSAFFALSVGSGSGIDVEAIATGYVRSLILEAEESNNSATKRDLLVKARQAVRAVNDKFSFGYSPDGEPPVLLKISSSLAELDEYALALPIITDALEQLRSDGDPNGKSMQEALAQSLIMNCHLGRPDAAVKTAQDIIRLLIEGNAAALAQLSHSIDDRRDMQRVLAAIERAQASNKLRDLLRKGSLRCSR